MTTPACFQPTPDAHIWHPSEHDDHGNVTEYERLACVGGEPVRVVVKPCDWQFPVGRDSVWMWGIDGRDDIGHHVERCNQASHVAAMAAADAWLAAAARKEPSHG